MVTSKKHLLVCESISVMIQPSALPQQAHAKQYCRQTLGPIQTLSVVSYYKLGKDRIALAGHSVTDRVHSDSTDRSEWQNSHPG